MEDWRSIMNRATSKTTDEREGINKGTLGVVENVSTETERVMLSDFGGGATANVTHPYVSIRSWIRVMPEEGTAGVLTRRGDSAVSEVSYYWSGDPGSRVKKYRDGVGNYRPLDRGEFEHMSYGMAQVYGSRYGALDLRGGITTGWLNNEDLEVGFKAPTHTRILHDKVISSLNGEERYGAVYRNSTKDGSREYYKVNGSFAKEYIRVISFLGIPSTLVDHREGHVFEDDGTRVKAPSGDFVRRRTMYFDSKGDFSEVTTDEQGNTWEILSGNATSGRVFRVPKGTFRIEAGVNIRMSAVKDIQCSARNMTIRTQDVIHLEGDIAVKIISKGMVTIDAPIIEVNGRSVQTATAPI